jgi:hypothetical protein
MAESNFGMRAQAGNSRGRPPFEEIVTRRGATPWLNSG